MNYCVCLEPFYKYFVFIFNMHFYNEFTNENFLFTKNCCFLFSGNMNFKRNLKLGATYISIAKTQTNISQNFVSFTGKGGGVKDISIMRIYLLDVQHHSTKAV